MEPTPDTVVFDIETQNFFTDPGVGWNNYGALKISVVGVYSYTRNEYKAFEEDEMGELATWFMPGTTVVGFSSNRYDVPVLHHYFQKLDASGLLDLWKMKRVDLLELIEMATGKRISLNLLAQANVGVGKTGHGSEAIELYKQGRIEELKEYCLQDVKLTKELYDIYLTTGTFMIPDRVTGELKPLHLKQVEATHTISNEEDGKKKTLF